VNGFPSGTYSESYTVRFQSSLGSETLTVYVYYNYDIRSGYPSLNDLFTRHTYPDREAIKLHFDGWTCDHVHKTYDATLGKFYIDNIAPSLHQGNIVLIKDSTRKVFTGVVKNGGTITWNVSEYPILQVDLYLSDIYAGVRRIVAYWTLGGQTYTQVALNWDVSGVWGAGAKGNAEWRVFRYPSDSAWSLAELIGKTLHLVVEITDMANNKITTPGTNINVVGGRVWISNYPNPSKHYKEFTFRIYWWKLSVTSITVKTQKDSNYVTRVLSNPNNGTSYTLNEGDEFVFGDGVYSVILIFDTNEGEKRISFSIDVDVSSPSLTVSILNEHVFPSSVLQIKVSWSDYSELDSLTCYITIDGNQFYLYSSQGEENTGSVTLSFELCEYSYEYRLEGKTISVTAIAVDELAHSSSKTINVNVESDGAPRIFLELVVNSSVLVNISQGEHKCLGRIWNNLTYALTFINATDYLLKNITIFLSNGVEETVWFYWSFNCENVSESFIRDWRENPVGNDVSILFEQLGLSQTDNITLRAIVYDAKGNKAVCSISFEVLFGAPTIYVRFPENGTILTDPRNITIGIIVGVGGPKTLDTMLFYAVYNSHEYSAVYDISGTQTLNTNITFGFEEVEEEGWIEVLISVNDTQGLRRNITLIYDTDLYPPSFDFLEFTLANNTIWLPKNISYAKYVFEEGNLTLTISDRHNFTLIVSLNGKAYFAGYPLYSDELNRFVLESEISFLPPYGDYINGWNKIAITAVDISGRKSKTTYLLFLDMTPPSVYMLVSSENSINDVPLFGNESVYTFISAWDHSIGLTWICIELFTFNNTTALFTKNISFDEPQRAVNFTVEIPPIWISGIYRYIIRVSVYDHVGELTGLCVCDEEMIYVDIVPPFTDESPPTIVVSHKRVGIIRYDTTIILVLPEEDFSGVSEGNVVLFLYWSDKSLRIYMKKKNETCFTAYITADIFPGTKVRYTIICVDNVGNSAYIRGEYEQPGKKELTWIILCAVIIIVICTILLIFRKKIFRRREVSRL